MATVGETSITVVVPTYNEAGNILGLLERIGAVLPAARIIVVDDGSPDGTADLVESSRVTKDEGVRVLRRSGKQGLGAAYRAGFAAALADGAEICIQMDADLSHDPQYLPALVSAVTTGADAALGSRYIPGGSIENWPRLRRFLSRWGNRFAAGMLGLAVNDATSGFRAYRRSLLEAMSFETVRAEGYGFQIEMTHRAVRGGARIIEVPILFKDRTVGESKLTHHIIGEAFVLVVGLW
ncbi:MAG: polyprenol monophosphomannose synthase [Ilumatobacteraceae bacterium]